MTSKGVVENGLEKPESKLSSLINKPEIIRKAMLRPKEKRIFSNAPKFSVSISLKIRKPGMKVI